MTSGTDLAVGDLMAQTNKHEREARAGASSTTNQEKKKRDDHAGEGYKVVMPPEKFIPLSVSDIIDSMRTSVRHEHRAAFTEICQLVEGCATTEFSGLRRRVKKNYRFFSQAAMRRDAPTRVGRGSAFSMLGATCQLTSAAESTHTQAALTAVRSTSDAHGALPWASRLAW